MPQIFQLAGSLEVQREVAKIGDIVLQPYEKHIKAVAHFYILEFLRNKQDNSQSLIHIHPPCLLHSVSLPMMNLRPSLP